MKRRPTRTEFYLLGLARRSDGVLEVVNAVSEIPETYSTQNEMEDGLVKLTDGWTDVPDGETGPSAEEIIDAIRRASVGSQAARKGA